MALFRTCRPQSRASRASLVPGGVACAARARRFTLSTSVTRRPSSGVTVTDGQSSASPPFPPASPPVG